MTSVMRRPHSSQPGDFGQGDLSRNASHSRSAAESQRPGNENNNGAGNTFSVSSPSALGMSGSDLSRIPTFPSHEDMTSSSSSSSNMANRHSSAFSGEASGSTMAAGTQYTHTQSDLSLRGLDLSSRTIFDDPGVLATANQSHQSYSTDPELSFDPNSSLLSSDYMAGASGSVSNAFSDLDLASSAMLQFPELPASLLDQAPEYEYSVHTQSNVFDAVQDYDGSGEEEAARVFGLNHYDPSIHANADERDGLSAGSGNESWSQDIYSIKQEDAMHGKTHLEGSQNVRSGSLSAYSNAPLTSGEGVTPFPEPGTMYRRESFDASGREESAGSSAAAVNSSPSTLFSYQQAQSQHVREDSQQRSAPGRMLEQGPFVPSQGLGSSNIHQRARLASWAGENLQYADEWSSPGHAHGMPAPSFRSGYPSIHGLPPRGGPFGVEMESRGGPRPDMVHSLGSAMDASMETDGVAKCPYPNCSKTFAKNRSYNLKAHLRSHSQLKPYQCTHCPRAFSRKHDLERHSRVHSGDKPYLCEACGKGFPRSDALRRHWRVEKECGDKAVEIEAKQPLPSLPPGVNVPTASAHAPMPGVMSMGPAVTTAIAGSGLPSSMGAVSELQAYSQLQHQQVQLQHHHPQPQHASYMHEQQSGHPHPFQPPHQESHGSSWSSNTSAMTQSGSNNGSSGPFSYSIPHEPRHSHGGGR